MGKNGSLMSFSPLSLCSDAAEHGPIVVEVELPAESDAARVGSGGEAERHAVHGVVAAEERRVDVAGEPGPLAAPRDPATRDPARTFPAELVRELVRVVARARVQIVDQELAVDLVAVRDPPRGVDRHDDVVAQRGARLRLGLRLKTLDQHVRDDADQVERLPARGLVARRFGDADAHAVGELPLDAVGGELLARGLLGASH